MTIIPYEESFRDDMIYMVLDAKNALGKVPSINPDLLDIRGSYLDRGDCFWLALDENRRVVGCIGFSVLDGENARLHRLYIKPERKRQGIGSALLKTAEEELRRRGIRFASVHLGGKEYRESRLFYPKHGYVGYAPDYMKKELL